MKFFQPFILLIALLSCGSYLDDLIINPSERTFYGNVCWKEDGTLQYVGCDEKDAFPMVNIWSFDKTYLDVVLTPNADQYKEVVTQAMKAWNEVIGHEFFRWGKGRFDVSVYYAPEIKDKFRGVVTFVRHGDNGTGAGVALSIPPGTNGLLSTVIHEFGHVLGLAHDPNDSKSVMYPRPDKHPRTISNADKRAIRTRYGML